MSPGEIALVYFPFGGSPGAKLRPALLLTVPTGPVPEVVCAYISSVIPSALLLTDIEMDPVQPLFVSTRLKLRSVLRLHKLATVHQRDVVRFLGTLSPAVMADVAQRLRAFLNL